MTLSGWGALNRPSVVPRHLQLRSARMRRILMPILAALLSFSLSAALFWNAFGLPPGIAPAIQLIVCLVFWFVIRRQVRRADNSDRKISRLSKLLDASEHSQCSSIMDGPLRGRKDANVTRTVH